MELGRDVPCEDVKFCGVSQCIYVDGVSRRTNRPCRERGREKGRSEVKLPLIQLVSLSQGFLHVKSVKPQNLPHTFPSFLYSYAFTLKKPPQTKRDSVMLSFSIE